MMQKFQLYFIYMNIKNVKDQIKQKHFCFPPGKFKFYDPRFTNIQTKKKYKEMLIYIVGVKTNKVVFEKDFSFL